MARRCRPSKFDGVNFKSAFEIEVYRVLHERGWKYESEKFDYVSSHTYTPDFSKRGQKFRFEAKGRFRPGETKKYLDIRKSNPDVNIVFIFMNPDTPVSTRSVPRKDGTKQTVSEWADKHGFQWTTIHNLRSFVDV